MMEMMKSVMSYSVLPVGSWIFQFVTERENWYFPGGGTILGGCYQKGNWDVEVDPNLATRIMKRAVDLFPVLTDGKGIEHLSVIRHNVGLRPLREGGVRLEKEKINGVWTVHNYGHGGYGYQSSYGCSKVAVKLVEEVLSPRAKLWRTRDSSRHYILKSHCLYSYFNRRAILRKHEHWCIKWRQFGAPSKEKLMFNTFAMIICALISLNLVSPFTLFIFHFINTVWPVYHHIRYNDILFSTKRPFESPAIKLDEKPLSL